ncbi:MAG: hypothetical protein EOO27_23815 [Comamonadaceae bacterium]|nr:MAG: hypothetical protein EOO27_23815 [Comamonadaceae bacterium]
MKDGAVHQSTCKAPRGSGPRGVQWEDVQDKFQQLFPLGGLPAATTAACLSYLRAFDQAPNVTQLTHCLAAPRPS